MPKFLSWDDIAERRSTSKSTEKRRVKDDPRHPRAVHVSPGRVAFPEPEIEDYDQLLIAERDEWAACAAEAEETAAEAEDREAEETRAAKKARGETEAEAEEIEAA